MMIKRLFFIVFFSVIYLTLSAQNGTITGRLTEKQKDKLEGLPFANVFLENTTYGATTDFDGNYTFKAPAGNYTLIASFMGYETLKKTITVPADGSITINVEMKPQGINIEGVQVVAKVNRESEVALMMEQKNAAIAVEAIGAKQLSTQGVGNAATAVTKITGITKQEGAGTLNVRGLGDRYNTTTLNGLPLPSDNAEVKNIDLELFTTDIISHISIEKNYSAHLFGDFGGANIDIVSKRHDGDAYLKLDIKGAYNSNMFSTDHLFLQGVESKSGFHKAYQPNVEKIKNNIYDFKNSWNPRKMGFAPDFGLGITAGKTFKFANTHKLNVFFTANFDNEKNFTKTIERNISGADMPLDDLRGEKFEYNTQSVGMLNLNYSASKIELYLNSMLLNASKQNFTKLRGELRDISEDGLRTQSQYKENMILVNQFLGTYKISDKNKLNWGFSHNYVKHNIPDKMRNTYTEYDSVSNIGIFDIEPSGSNYRYFQTFDDNELAGNLAFSQNFGNSINDDDSRGKWTIGVFGRYKNRSFNSQQFNHQIPPPSGTDISTNISDIDKIVNDNGLKNDIFDVNVIEADGKPGFFYKGILLNTAVFGTFYFNLTADLSFILGARLENIHQTIDYLSTQNPTGKEEQSIFSKLSILPSLSLKYSLTKKQNLRLAFSKTYTLPQFQEMPLLVFEGITDRTYGNPNIYPSQVYNADIKWEFFPKNGELFSATIFGKYIIDPINKFVVNGSLNEYTNANTGEWAYLYGIELDAKKNIFKKIEEKHSHKLFVAANLTLMKTWQELNAEKIVKETKNNFNSTFNKDKEELQGAAPLIANASLTYNHKWKEQKNGITTALVYNYVSDRLYAIGHSSLGNKYDKAITTLDFIIKTKFNHLEIGLSAKNILNADYERIQKNKKKTHIVSAYKRGTKIAISVSYKF